MADCSRCGDCCDPVWYPFAPGDLRQSAHVAGRGEGGHAANLVFAAAHWHPTGATRDGLHAYACDRFDAASRLCTAHEDRPPICRGYPWYDGPPTSAVFLPVACSYREDLRSLQDRRSTGAAEM